MRVQVESGGERLLLFPEAIVDLNETAYAVLSRLPCTRKRLEADLRVAFGHDTDAPLPGLDEFINASVRRKWICTNFGK